MPRLVAVVLVSTAILALPAAASATLVHGIAPSFSPAGGQEGPSAGQNVVAIPFAGGAPTILVRRASTPDWNA